MKACRPTVEQGGNKVFDEQGRLTDERAKEHIRKLLERLANWTWQLEKGQELSAQSQRA